MKHDTASSHLRALQELKKFRMPELLQLPLQSQPSVEARHPHSPHLLDAPAGLFLPSLFRQLAPPAQEYQIQTQLLPRLHPLLNNDLGLERSSLPDATESVHHK